MRLLGAAIGGLLVFASVVHASPDNVGELAGTWQGVGGIGDGPAETVEWTIDSAGSVSVTISPSKGKPIRFNGQLRIDDGQLLYASASALIKLEFIPGSPRKLKGNGTIEMGKKRTWLDISEVVGQEAKQ